MEYPKPKRVVDPALVAAVRSIEVCFMRGRGECWGGLDVHHRVSRGAGGGDTLDNLMLLCRGHHTLVHAGKISEECLEECMGESNRRRIALHRQ